MAFHRGGLLLLISHEIYYQSLHELHTGINMTKPYDVKIKLHSGTVIYDKKGLYPILSKCDPSIKRINGWVTFAKDIIMSWVHIDFQQCLSFMS